MLTNKKILEYEVYVDNLILNDKPVQHIGIKHFNKATELFDQLKTIYPQRTVRLFSIAKEEIKVAEGISIAKDHKCPRGHSGKDWNKKPVVYENGRGMLICSICDWIGPLPEG